MVNPIINKQNNRVVGFNKSISDVRCVSTTKYQASAIMLEDISDVLCVSTIKYPASAIMLGIVASNREKMPPDWLTSVTG